MSATEIGLFAGIAAVIISALAMLFRHTVKVTLLEANIETMQKCLKRIETLLEHQAGARARLDESFAWIEELKKQLLNGK